MIGNSIVDRYIAIYLQISIKKLLSAGVDYSPSSACKEHYKHTKARERPLLAPTESKQ